MVDRNSPIPIYYQLKLHFKQQMENGVLHVGDRLPTEMELCEQYHISRAPVRQALTELAREGLIYRRPGQGSFIAPQASASLEEKTTIRVLTHYDVRWMASLEEAVHFWNPLHPEHEVKLELMMCSRDDFHQTLHHAVVQGEAPDIAPLDYAWITNYAKAGYITSLNSLDAAWVTSLTEDLESPVVENNSVDGQLYGIPIQADVTGLWYRKDWFAQEGVQPPQTWSDWLSVMDHFARPEVQQRFAHDRVVVLPVTSVAGEATVNLLISFLWQAGGAIVDEVGNLTLNHPAICEALRFLQEITLKRRSYLPEDVANYRWWDLSRFLAHGTVPMSVGGTYEWPRIREESDWADEEPDALAHLGFAALPRPSLDVPPVGSLGGTSWTILRQSSVQELTMEILKLAASPEMSADFCVENLQISPHRSVNRRFNCDQYPWLSSIIPFLSIARTRPLVHNYLQVSRFLQQMFEQVLWAGMSPEETVQRTAQSLKVLLTV